MSVLQGLLTAVLGAGERMVIVSTSTAALDAIDRLLLGPQRYVCQGAVPGMQSVICILPLVVVPAIQLGPACCGEGHSKSYLTSHNCHSEP
jgi:hypothetical protein